MHIKEFSQGLAHRKYSINAQSYFVPLLAAAATGVERHKSRHSFREVFFWLPVATAENGVVRIPIQRACIWYGDWVFVAPSKMRIYCGPLLCFQYVCFTVICYLNLVTSWRCFKKKCYLCFLEWNLLFPVSGRSTTALALRWILFELVGHFK